MDGGNAGAWRDGNIQEGAGLALWSVRGMFIEDNLHAKNVDWASNLTGSPRPPNDFISPHLTSPHLMIKDATSHTHYVDKLHVLVCILMTCIYTNTKPKPRQ